MFDNSLVFFKIYPAALNQTALAVADTDDQ